MLMDEVLQVRIDMVGLLLVQNALRTQDDLVPNMIIEIVPARHDRRPKPPDKVLLALEVDEPLVVLGRHVRSLIACSGDATPLTKHSEQLRDV